MGELRFPLLADAVQEIEDSICDIFNHVAARKATIEYLDAVLEPRLGSSPRLLIFLEFTLLYHISTSEKRTLNCSSKQMFGESYEAVIGIQPKRLSDLEAHDRMTTLKRTSFEDQLQKWIGTNNNINVVNFNDSTDEPEHLIDSDTLDANSCESLTEPDDNFEQTRIVREKCVTSKKWKKNEAIYHSTKRVSGMTNYYEEQNQYIHESDIKRQAFEQSFCCVFRDFNICEFSIKL
ncbi:hypothetical protein B9Z55_023395 [Caenorhabditis nigoni]|uniref:Uncharacterized protein n=1 Tax=Caenorhabditis nigoni TaxID=1611254 RepID=A0A2G5SQ55_9PELO|nr:hypothetical protein B9Z55_023395 [Caenorhabditis nigoni]